MDSTKQVNNMIQEIIEELSLQFANVAVGKLIGVILISSLILVQLLIKERAKYLFDLLLDMFSKGFNNLVKKFFKMDAYLVNHNKTNNVIVSNKRNIIYLSFLKIHYSRIELMLVAYFLAGFWRYMSSLSSLYYLGLSIIQVFSEGYNKPSSYRTLITLLILAIVEAVVVCISEYKGIQKQIEINERKIKCLIDSTNVALIKQSNLKLGQVVILEVGQEVPAECLLFDVYANSKSDLNLNVLVDEKQIDGEANQRRKRPILMDSKFMTLKDGELNYNSNNVLKAGSTIRDIIIINDANVDVNVDKTNKQVIAYIIQIGNDCPAYDYKISSNKRQTPFDEELNVVFNIGLFILSLISGLSSVIYSSNFNKPFWVDFCERVLYLNMLIPIGINVYYYRCSQIGARRIMKQLPSVIINPKGCTAIQAQPTTIVSDKTGTLTLNKGKLLKCLSIDSVQKINKSMTEAATNWASKPQTLESIAASPSTAALTSDQVKFREEIARCMGEQMTIHDIVNVDRGVDFDFDDDDQVVNSLACNSTMVNPNSNSNTNINVNVNNDKNLNMVDSGDYLILQGLINDAKSSVKLIKNDYCEGFKGSFEWINTRTQVKTQVLRLLTVGYNPLYECKYSITQQNNDDSKQNAKYLLHVQGTPEAIAKYLDPRLTTEYKKMLEIASEVAEELYCYKRMIAYGCRQLTIDEVKSMLNNVDGDSMQHYPHLRCLIQPRLYVIEDAIIPKISDSINEVVSSGHDFIMCTGDMFETAKDVYRAILSAVSGSNDKSMTHLDDLKILDKLISGKKLNSKNNIDIKNVNDDDDVDTDTDDEELNGNGKVLFINGRLLPELLTNPKYRERAIILLSRYLNKNDDNNSGDWRFIYNCDGIVVYRATPSGKETLVRFLKNYMKKQVLMIGDGMNDVPAMIEANFSVAVVGESEKPRSVCDAYITDWHGLPSLLSELSKARELTRTSCKWVLMQNSIKAYTNLGFMLLSSLHHYKDSDNFWLGQFLKILVFFLVSSHCSYDQPRQVHSFAAIVFKSIVLGLMNSLLTFLIFSNDDEVTYQRRQHDVTIPILVLQQLLQLNQWRTRKWTLIDRCLLSIIGMTCIWWWAYIVDYKIFNHLSYFIVMILYSWIIYY